MAITLKVDQILNNGSSAVVKDFEKIKYNIELLGSDFESDIMIRLPFTDGFLNTVNTVGRYIMIMQIDKEFTKGKMMFFDHLTVIDLDKMKQGISRIFSPFIGENFYQNYLSLRLVFKPELDLALLTVD